MTSRLSWAPLSLAAWLVVVGTASSQTPTKDPRAIEFFETKIRPVLATQCYECHSAKSSKVKGGLLLDTRLGLAEGGDSGPILIPGQPEKSLLIRALRHQEMKMPPKTKLPENVIQDFVRWVQMGAPDPRGGASGGKGYTTLSLEDAKSFWSFVPPVKKDPPKVKNTTWARGNLDRFALGVMEAKGLTPVKDADRHTLLRRLSFDIIGLPPTPAEIDAFVGDKSANAIEKVVDRLLASKHFGERWGRHWLDVARYAESNGNADNVPFPYAYRFRDWVIDAYNQDKPYDRFIAEQIAGDLLPAKDADAKDDQMIATGFLALTSKPRAQNNPDYKMDIIADQIDVTSRAVLGMSVMCARCHDHKFDPFPTKEYYSLAGIFESSNPLFGPGGKGAKGTGGYHRLSDGSFTMGVGEGKVVDTNLCVRGDSTKKGDRIPRGLLTAVSFHNPAPAIKSGSGRLELAQWLTRPENPLTARVAVNRIWQHLFGQGIVPTPDNFGQLGELPTHPELLDYLALRFVDLKWSTKAMIREIALSRVYQLSSEHDAANYKIDAETTYLWRARTRRLDAESIRDAMLAVSGRLDPAPLKGSALGMAKGMAMKGGFTLTDIRNRSVYLAMVRGAPMAEILSLFDVANPNLVVAQREVTTVPSQALFMMNSPFVVGEAKSFAARLLEPKDQTEAQRIDAAYRLALGRPARDIDQKRAQAFLAETTKASNATQAWTSFCQAILASAEFRYVQ